jgi:hypothetical protein
MKDNRRRETEKIILRKDKREQRQWMTIVKEATTETHGTRNTT